MTPGYKMVEKQGKQEVIRKTLRFDKETLEMLEDLKSVYSIPVENMLLKQIIKDIYEIKKSKSLVPFEELKKTDQELKIALLKLGELQGSLKEKENILNEKERLIQEKERQIKELEELTGKNKKNKGFWARLFGL